ncbi:MAG: phage gp6-like head-tail connector protein [Clostridiales bacterium]|nr:phage gp6-like head-tail connector protein [Clostridiales bacterium]
MALSEERRASLLAYCKLTELADDPEVQALIPVMYEASVGYMENAGINVPESGTTRAALYDLCVNYMVANAWDQRDTTVAATVIAENPMFRQYLLQLKLTEGDGSLG